MRLYRLDSFGDDLAGLSLHHEPAPQPGPGEVLVRMGAVSLNYRDLIVARGKHPNVSPGTIPVSDGTGEVMAIGERVYRVKPGDRVVASFNQTWLAGPAEADSLRGMLGGFVDGLLAEQVVLDQHGLVKLPDALTFEQGATLPCAGVTAWSALTCGPPLRPGQTLLVQGTGGVSIFALQLGVLFGARVVAITSSDAKAEQLHKLGATHVINYSETPQWGRRVRALTGDVGVDRIVEVGGPSTLEESLSCTAMGAQVALVGHVGGLGATINPRLLMMNQLSTHAVAVGSRAALVQLVNAVEVGDLNPVIDRVFSFEEAATAYRYLDGRKHVGKVVIRIAL